MARSSLRMDSAGAFYIKTMGPGSGAERHVRGRSNRVAQVARVLAPKRRGDLARSISVSQNRDERGRFTFGFTVSAQTGYAAFVHEGTGPSIRSKFPGTMKFPGTNQYSGQTIHTEIVHHPGTPANPFLQRALMAAR